MGAILRPAQDGFDVYSLYSMSIMGKHVLGLLYTLGAIKARHFLNIGIRMGFANSVIEIRGPFQVSPSCQLSMGHSIIRGSPFPGKFACVVRCLNILHLQGHLLQYAESMDRPDVGLQSTLHSVLP
jgi:hypothetical protein